MLVVLRIRKEDPKIAKMIKDALGSAQSLLNVGAGSGSYEPDDRFVVSIEPSREMRSQRGKHRVPAINGSAECIPFDDCVFDASMAVLTVHHWINLGKGLSEMKRVTKGPVIIMTFDPFAATEFWLYDYLPEMLKVDQNRYPRIDRLSTFLGTTPKIVEVPVSRDCADKFQVALYSRPEEFLRMSVRKSQSAWSHLKEGLEEGFVKTLSSELESGKWDKKYGDFRKKTVIKCQLRILIFQ